MHLWFYRKHESKTFTEEELCSQFWSLLRTNDASVAGYFIILSTTPPPPSPSPPLLPPLSLCMWCAPVPRQGLSISSLCNYVNVMFVFIVFSRRTLAGARSQLENIVITVTLSTAYSLSVWTSSPHRGISTSHRWILNWQPLVWQPKPLPLEQGLLGFSSPYWSVSGSQSNSKLRKGSCWKDNAETGVTLFCYFNMYNKINYLHYIKDIFTWQLCIYKGTEQQKS